MPSPIPPLRKEILVRWTPEVAFRRFTSEMGSWWPLSTHSVGADEAETVEFEGRVGGRIVEKIRGGRESIWGTVMHWDPPRRVTFTWHPSRTPDTAGTVEVTFHPHSSGTLVTLVHGDWEKFGPKAPMARRGYAVGWGGVLAIYAGRPGAPIVRLNNALAAIAGLASRLRKRDRVAGHP